jgi:hypothetical protein
MARLTIWIPKDLLWLKDKVREIQTAAEAEGIRLSEGSVILAALQQVWDPPEKSVSAPATRQRKKHKRRVMYFSNEHAWIAKKIEEIVETKKLAGIKTSFSHEVTRILKNQFLRTKHGEKFDRMLLEE